MIRLAIRVPDERAEMVLVELLELAPAGVEESSTGGVTSSTRSTARPESCRRCPTSSALAGGGLVEISTSEVADDWQERWKQFHHPVLVPAPENAESGPGPIAADTPAVGARRARLGRRASTR